MTSGWRRWFLLCYNCSLNFMAKKLPLLVCTLLILFLIPFVFYMIVSASIVSPDSTDIKPSRIQYKLPYPGILPGHPLYIFKAFRDKILDWSTRDLGKKAELILLLSDKRLSMAYFLAKNNNGKLAINTLSKGEKYLEKIPQLMADMKNQGSAAETGFIAKAKLSSLKHREMIGEIQRQLPRGYEKEIAEILQRNAASIKALEKFP